MAKSQKKKCYLLLALSRKTLRIDKVATAGVEVKRIKITKKQKLKCLEQILIHCWRLAFISVT